MTPGQLRLLTIALGLSVFMNALDISIANVSIPSIAGNLAVSPQHGTWVITAFAASRAIVLPISGWMAKRVGEVKLFVLSTLAFSIFSFLCGSAGDFMMLLLARVLQGIAAGPTMPLSQSLLLANYPKERHGFANGIWAMTIVIGPVAGPVLGGWLTDNLSWPWIFYINVPVGIFAAAVSWILLKERETDTRKEPIDVVGLGLLAIGVIALQLLMDQGNDNAWFQSNYIVALGCVSVVAFSFFVVWELTDEHPVVDLKLLGRRNFMLATVAVALIFMARFGGIVIFPLWLQDYHGYTATWAGLSLASMGIMAFFASPIVGRLVDKFDPRIFLTVGLLIYAVLSFIKGSFNTQVTFWQLFLTRLPWGIGSACLLIPLMTLAFAGLPRERVASASGLFNFVRLLALSFGTSLSVSLWDKRGDLHEHFMNARITPYQPAAQHWLQIAQQLGLTRKESFLKLSHLISKQAFMFGLNDVYWLFGWVFLGLILLIWCTDVSQR